MNRILSLVICAGLATLAAAPAAAQQAQAHPSSAARWTAWHGCWQVAEESVEDTAQLLGLMGMSPTRATASPGAIVCVTPSGNGGATITTLVNDRPVLTETMVPDGTARPLTDADCRGSQKAEWSTLGARVFARAEITCGNQPSRTVYGLSAMVAGPMWLDIQMIESEGRKSVRVRRYRRAANQAQAAVPASPAREIASMPLGRKLSLPEIAEASAKLPADVVQAAVLELGTGGYDLKAKQLRELHAAHVPASVIDLMVAMSYPERFVVERVRPAGGFGGGSLWDPTTDMWPYMAMWPYAGMWPYGSFYNSSLYDFYSPFYSAHYSPFGYRYWGYVSHDYLYNYGGLVVLNPGGGAGGGGEITPSGEGRVVDGRGYTRIRRTEPDAPARINGNNGGFGTASAAGGSSSTGSGSSGVSSGGYSSGGGGGGGERVAVPRPPGT